MTRRLYGTLIIALSVILFLALNVFSNTAFRNARIDLTDNGLFTLSDGTRETLQAIEEPITLRYFYSERLATGYPTISAYGTRVRDMLAEFKAVAGDRLKLEIIDPEPYSPDEDLATSYGIQAVPTQSGETLFFGLSGTNLANGQETIPFFFREREQFLEYELTEMVHKLSTLVKPKVAYISSLPLQFGPGGLAAMQQGLAQPLLIYQSLEENFDLVELEDGFDRIDEDVQVLLVAHPDILPAKSLYAIDQFVLRGGRALVFLDPHSELNAQPGQFGQPNPGAVTASTLDPLLAAWGVDMPLDQVVADANRAQRVIAPGPQRREVFYVIWMSLLGEDISRDDLVTAEINELGVGTAGYLKILDDKTTDVTPLFQTTQDAMLIDVAQVRIAPNPQRLLTGYAPGGERLTLGVRISGAAKSAYPDGAPPEETPEGENDESAEEEDKVPLPAHLAEAVSPINVIVVADSDLFDDNFWVQKQNFLGQTIAQPVADNSTFVVNAIDNLMGSDALISLRSRSASERPFKVVDELRRSAEAQYLREEEELNAKISSTEARLRDLQRQAPETDGLEGAYNIAALSEEQQAEVERFRRELAESRAALRDVQRNLRKDIDALGNRLRILNIGVLPLLVGLFAVGMFYLRSRRRAEASARR